MSIYPRVTVLFCREDSIYKRFPVADPWDAKMDALNSDEGLPCVAHPPCRAWGRMRHFAKPRIGEMDLAFWAVDRIRIYGGVLEHPSSSALWKAKGLPRPGAGIDQWGGWTLQVDQVWWGHKAKKRTWLYIVGAGLAEVPAIPLSLEGPKGRIRLDKRRRDGSRIRKGDADHVKDLSKAEREQTPPTFAEWLMELAEICGYNVAEEEAA